MSEHRFTIQLDSRFDSDRAAWNKLNRIQQQKHLSFNRIVSAAVNAYEENSFRLSPEDEERLAARIAESVTEKLKQTLPACLVGCHAGSAAPQTQTIGRTVPNAPLPSMQTVPNEEAADFTGTVMDFGFLGL